MSKQLTAIGQICQAIDKMTPSLNESLNGTGVSVARFLATAKTAVQTHAQKDRLANADRNSLYLAIKKSASDGLMPDNREAALVIYGDQVQYQPMVQGLVKLARQSGEVESIGAYIVYEKDNFEYKVGIDPVPQHEAGGDDNLGWFSADRGAPVGVWAYVKMKSGDYLEPVMLSRDRVNRIASRSKQAKNYDPAVGKDWEEFWKKAAIRNILKYAPRSTALDKALVEANGEFTYDEEPIKEVKQKPAEPKKQKKTKAEEVIEADTKEREPEDGEPEIIDLEPVEIEDEEVPV